MVEKKLNSIRKAHVNNSLILPDGTIASMDSIKTRTNNNVMIIGATGSQKTRGYVEPNLLAMVGSYIVSDTKGNLYNKWGDCFRRDGYRVVHLNFIHPELSDHYNPLAYICTSNDVQKLAHLLVYGGDENGQSKGKSYDPFWDKANELLMSAIIGYLIEKMELGQNASLSDASGIIAKIDASKWEDGEKCKIDNLFIDFSEEYHSKTGKNSWAYQQYLKFRATPPKTMGCIMMTAHTTLSCLDTEEIRNMLAWDDVDIISIGKRRTVVFTEVSDTDRSKDVLANLFYSQAMNCLCSYADEECKDSRLPVPVRFILDDFGTNCRIEGFQNMISNIRSRGISASIILQSCFQLSTGYGDSAHTIINNCDTLLYLGGNDPDTAQFISQRVNKPVARILSMPIGTNWIMRRGEGSRFSKTVDLSEYDLKMFEKSPLRRYHPHNTSNNEKHTN